MLISSNSSALVDSNKSRCRKLCFQNRGYEIIDLPVKCVRNGLYSEIASIVQTRCIIHATKTTRRTTRSTKVDTLRIFFVTFVFILDKVTRLLNVREFYPSTKKGYFLSIRMLCSKNVCYRYF